MRHAAWVLLPWMVTTGCATLYTPYPITDSDDGTGTQQPGDTDRDDTNDTFGGPDLPDTALTSDTGTSKLCGNGTIDPGEYCEGTDLQGETCESVGFAAGDLACGSNCRLDTTACLETPPGGVFCDTTQLSISSSGRPTVEGYLTIAEAATILEVEVSIQGYHGWIGDLDFYLTHDGVEVLLAQPSSASGNCDSDGVIDVSFDDDAFTDSYACDNANDYLGTRVPLSPLSAFDGKDMTGLWTLRVEDLAVGDGGAITNWCVSINPTAP